MYWNILVWLRIEIPDGFLHQISENLKIDDLVTGGTINLQLTPHSQLCSVLSTSVQLYSDLVSAFPDNVECPDTIVIYLYCRFQFKIQTLKNVGP